MPTLMLSLVALLRPTYASDTQLHEHRQPSSSHGRLSDLAVDEHPFSGGRAGLQHQCIRLPSASGARHPLHPPPCRPLCTCIHCTPSECTKSLLRPPRSARLRLEQRQLSQPPHLSRQRPEQLRPWQRLNRPASASPTSRCSQSEGRKRAGRASWSTKRSPGTGAACGLATAGWATSGIAHCALCMPLLKTPPAGFHCECRDAYLPGVLALYRSMRVVGSCYPLIVMHTRGVR